MTKRLVITYPVIFENAPVCELKLPKDLTLEEAERVKLMVAALVIPQHGEAA